MWQKTNAYGGLIGKPGSKESLGMYRHRPKDNIKMDLTEIR
jgi:hypothetical protein